MTPDASLAADRTEARRARPATIRSVSTPRRCASSATGRWTRSSTGSSDPSVPALGRATALRELGQAAGSAPAQAEDVRRLARAAVLATSCRAWPATTTPGRSRSCPDARTWPGALGDFIASALQRGRGLVAGVAAGPIAGRARGARLVQGVDRLSGDGRRDRSQRRLGGEHDGARVRARALAGAMSDDLVVYVLRPGALVGGPGGADPRLPAATRCACCRPTSASGSGSTRSRRDRSGRRGRTACRCSSSRTRVATSTGAVDPFAELAALCRDRGVWLHVDGAYGAFAVLTERGAQLLAGLELADSVTLDPHKWLFQPFECGCLLVRDGPRAARRVRDLARLPEGRGRPTARSTSPTYGLQLTPLVAGAQAVALGPLLRARRLPRRDRPRASTSREHAERGSRRATAFELAVACLARRRLLPPALSEVCPTSSSSRR